MNKEELEIVGQAVKEAVDETLDSKLDEKLDARLGPIEERLNAQDSEPAGDDDGQGEEDGEPTVPTGDELDEKIKQIVAEQMEGATKALSDEFGELKNGIEQLVGARKSIDDEPDGDEGDPDSATKSAVRRDPYGRRVKARS